MYYWDVDFDNLVKVVLARTLSSIATIFLI